MSGTNQCTYDMVRRAHTCVYTSDCRQLSLIVQKPFARTITCKLLGYLFALTSQSGMTEKLI
jgi:hypothetical protein